MKIFFQNCLLIGKIKEVAYNKNYATPMEWLITWIDIVLNFSSIIASFYSAFSLSTLWATEQYLTNYNIGYINAQASSINLLMYSIVMLGIILLIFACEYLFEISFSSKFRKVYLIMKWIFFTIVYFLLLICIFLIIISKNLSIFNVSNIIKICIDSNYETIFFIISIIFSTATMYVSWTFTNILEISFVQRFIVLAIAVIMTGICSCDMNKDWNNFQTVHLSLTEEINTWNENIPIANDGKQIWAVVYENSNYYFVEPLKIIENSDDEYEEKIVNQKYNIDKTRYIALDKSDVVVYSETVGDLNKKNDG